MHESFKDYLDIHRVGAFLLICSMFEMFILCIMCK